MYSCFGLWVDAVEICPRNRPQLCNSIHNSFHKHNMEATLSHMQTHGQIKDWRAKGDSVHSELLAEPLTVCLSHRELVCDRPKQARSHCCRDLCYILHLQSKSVTCQQRYTLIQQETIYSRASSHKQIPTYTLVCCFPMYSVNMFTVHDGFFVHL